MLFLNRYDSFYHKRCGDAILLKYMKNIDMNYYLHNVGFGRAGNDESAQTGIINDR